MWKHVLMLLLVAVAFASASNYVLTESSFSASERLTPSGTVFINPTLGTRLAPSKPTQPEVGYLYLRAKSGKSYGWYKGTANKSAWATLNVFPLGDLPVSDAINLKFYGRKDRKPFQDEAMVYFDNNYVYCSNVDELWFKRSKTWESLKRDPRNHGEFILSSIPVAEVWTLKEKIGETPYQSLGLRPGIQSVILKAQGFLPIAVGVLINSGETREQSTSLIPFQNLEVATSTSAIGVSETEITQAKQVEELDALNHKIEVQLKNLQLTEDSLRGVFDQLYPKMMKAPEGTDNWSDPGYQAYQQNYMQASKEAIDLMFKPLQSRLQPLNELREQIRLKVAALESRTVFYQGKPTALKFELVDSLVSKYKIQLKMKSKDSKVDFAWSGTLLLDSGMTTESLQKAFDDSTSSIQLKVSFQNKAVRITKADSTVQRFFYRFEKLELVQNSKITELPGEFFLPPFLLSNLEVKEWLDRDKLMAQKRKQIQDQKQFEEEELRRKKEQSESETVKLAFRGPVTEVLGGSFLYRGKKVSISPYALNTSEISQEHFLRIAIKNRSADQGEFKPVTHVTWDEANSFCTEVGGALPTEAQWEFAGRGGTDYQNYWNLDTAMLRTSENTGSERVWLVTQGAPNPLGLFNMGGNVSEWVKDNHSYFSIMVEPKDPTGAFSGHFKVFKGGSYANEPQDINMTDRDWEDPRYWGPRMGFRCAFPAQQQIDIQGVKSILAKKDSLLQKSGLKFKPLDQASAPVAAQPKPASAVVSPGPTAPVVAQPKPAPAVAPAAPASPKPIAVPVQNAKPAPVAPEITPAPVSPPAEVKPPSPESATSQVKPAETPVPVPVNTPK
jgi:hypothetical protein